MVSYFSRFFFLIFFSDDNLQSLNIHVGFSLALKSVGGRSLREIKALCGLREAQPHRDAALPRRCLAGSGVSPELDPKLMRFGRAGRAAVQDQARFIAMKL